MVEVDSPSLIPFTMPNNNFKLGFKALVLGDSKVGKSSLI